MITGAGVQVRGANGHLRPGRPFSEASIEGNKSVFALYFWKMYIFEGLEDVDRQLKWFNDSSLKYTQ